MNVADFRGIDRKFVEEHYAEQLKTKKVFVVAITDEREWSNEEVGYQIMFAQSRTGLSSSEFGESVNLLNGWDENTVVFGYQNATAAGFIPNSEESLGKTVEELLFQNKGIKKVARLVITDQTTPITYTKGGKVVTVEPRKTTKGELLGTKDGEAIYRKVTLELANNALGIIADTIIPAKAAWSRESQLDLFGTTSVD
ncbi:MAG TPA: hypothetical protein PKD00_00645 [Burkholderiales bacterium]|nr:hypothetical protein [Burkholderiales bacterium]